MHRKNLFDMKKIYFGLFLFVCALESQSAQDGIQNQSPFSRYNYRPYAPEQNEFPVEVEFSQPFWTEQIVNDQLVKRTEQKIKKVANRFKYIIQLQPGGPVYEGDYFISQKGFKVFKEGDNFFVDTWQKGYQQYLRQLAQGQKS